MGSVIDALAEFEVAKQVFAAAIGEAHQQCAHHTWIERGTFRVASYMSPIGAVRICRQCRAEMHDHGIYREWLSHGEYSYRKPETVDIVLTPSMAGLTDDTFYSLRLPSDPRPHFYSFSEVCDWQPPHKEPLT